MSVTYSTNWMGPVNMKWYSDRGLTRKVSKLLEEDQRFGDLKAGDTWTYDEITTEYACGRIDIRGLDPEKYWNGWDEYGVAPMHGEDWNALGDFLDRLSGEKVVPYESLIMLFEAQYGRKIRWATDQWVTCYNCWTINGHTEDCDKPLLET